VFFGLLTLLAVTVQAISLNQKGVFNPVNFLSYFTNLSNIFVAVVFLISTIYLLRSRKPSPRDDIIRGASVLYMAVTGVVYATLLSKYELGLTLQWVNLVLHYIMPLVVVLDWLYRPQQTKLVLRQTMWWLIFPALYLAYSLIRGPIVHWYPYPFLNPNHVAGYGGVALFCVGILAILFVFSWLLMKVGNSLRQKLQA
jgi:hypothetical protein